MLLDYFYFRIFRFAEVVAMGLSNVIPRAAALLSFILLFNTATFLEQVGWGLNKKSIAFYLIFLFVIYYLSYRFFSDNERKNRVYHQYYKESWLHTFVGNSVVAIICIGTIISFVIVKASWRMCFCRNLLYVLLRTYKE